MFKKLIIALLITIPVALHAQEPKPPEAGFAFGAILHFYGFGIDAQYYKYGDVDLQIGVNFSSYKHPKEAKVTSAYADQGGKKYIYDKKNFCYVLTPSIGIAKEVIPQTFFNRMNVKLFAAAGPTLSILKPYYIEYVVPTGGNQARLETGPYDASLYNYGNIFGEADFFLGMNELQVVPGLQARAGTVLGFSRSKSFIRAFELGGYFNFFGKPLELMDLEKDPRMLLGGYIEILIGNSW